MSGQGLIIDTREFFRQLFRFFWTSIIVNNILSDCFEMPLQKGELLCQDLFGTRKKERVLDKSISECDKGINLRSNTEDINFRAQILLSFTHHAFCQFAETGGLLPCRFDRLLLTPIVFINNGGREGE